MNFKANFQIDIDPDTNHRLNMIATMRRILKKDAIREAIVEYVKKYENAA